MKIVTAEVMRSIDAEAINSGIPSLNLMERAGICLADKIKELFPPSRGKIIVIAGRGNNGGDGLVCARYLIEAGYDVEVDILDVRENLSPDSEANFERLAPICSNIRFLTDESALNLSIVRWTQAVCFVDAIFGTGLSKNITGFYANVIEEINKQSGVVVSADIPSGLLADTGLVLGVAIKAKFTVTFGFPKLGFFVGEGANYIGKFNVVDIGIPKDVSDKHPSPYNLTDPKEFESKLQKRSPNDHKGTYGHVLVIAGNSGKLGAGYLSSFSALKSGSGLVTYALPKYSFEKFDTKYSEIMPELILDNDRGYFVKESVNDVLKILDGKDAIALGPAIGTEKPTVEFVRNILPKIKAPVVLDADGLNCIAGHTDILKQRAGVTIITPHPGEMSRLLGIDTKIINEKRIQAAVKLAVQDKVIIVLKGHNTIMTDGKIVYINPTGNQGMATAGSGDVLTGIIASLLAQKVDPLWSAIIGVYVHGFAGDQAVKTTGERGLVASDIIKGLGVAWGEIGQ